jgi:serine/threonine protein kinase
VPDPSNFEQWQGVRSPTNWYNVIGDINHGDYTDTYLVVKDTDKPDNATLSVGSGELYGLKIINAQMHEAGEDNALEMFIQERDFLSTTNNPTILSIKDIGTWEEYPFYIYEYCADRLDYIIDDDMSCIQKISYAFQLTSALTELEQSNVIHRDIKPANILIDDHNCVLSDFGLMTYYQNYISLTSSDTAFTRNYPAPEFANKYNDSIEKLTTKANVFQLGLVLAELFTGDSPSRGTELDERMEYRGTDEISEIDCADEYEGDIRETLEKMLEENPDRRPPASEVIYDWELIFKSVTDSDNTTDEFRV